MSVYSNSRLDLSAAVILFCEIHRGNVIPTIGPMICGTFLDASGTGRAKRTAPIADERLGVIASPVLGVSTALAQYGS